MISQTQMLTLNPSVLFLEHFGCWLGTFLILFLEPLDFIFCKPFSWMTDDTDDFLFIVPSSARLLLTCVALFCFSWETGSYRRTRGPMAFGMSLRPCVIAGGCVCFGVAFFWWSLLRLVDNLFSRMGVACRLGPLCLAFQVVLSSWRKHGEVRGGLVWTGARPGLEQSSYRAELLAVTVALASFSCVTVFCDNFQVVTYAAKLLKMPARFRCDHLPEEHKDLWRYFCSCTQLRAWGDCIVRWVKAHQDVASLDGQDRILAIFNGYADAEAKKVVVERARCALYRELFASCHANKEAAVRLADMHVAITQAFVEVDRPRRVCLDPAGFQVVGRGVALSELEAGPQVHEAFSKVLVQWLGALRWFPTCAAGWSGITAIEFAVAVCLRYWHAAPVLV